MYDEGGEDFPSFLCVFEEYVLLYQHAVPLRNRFAEHRQTFLLCIFMYECNEKIYILGFFKIKYKIYLTNKKIYSII